MYNGPGCQLDQLMNMREIGVNQCVRTGPTTFYTYLCRNPSLGPTPPPVDPTWIVSTQYFYGDGSTNVQCDTSQSGSYTLRSFGRGGACQSKSGGAGLTSTYCTSD